MTVNNPNCIIADEELINSLLQNNNYRRKAEEELLSRHAYFIREGMGKYSLMEEEAFDACSDTILQAIDNINKSAF